MGKAAELHRTEQGDRMMVRVDGETEAHLRSKAMDQALAAMSMERDAGRVCSANLASVLDAAARIARFVLEGESK